MTDYLCIGCSYHCLLMFDGPTAPTVCPHCVEQGCEWHELGRKDQEEKE